MRQYYSVLILWIASLTRLEPATEPFGGPLCAYLVFGIPGSALIFFAFCLPAQALQIFPAFDPLL